MLVLDHAGGEVVVTDRHAIGRVLGILHGLSARWAFLSGNTYPSFPTRLVFHDRAGAMLCIVDVGDGSIGSDCGKPEKGWPPLASVPQNVTTELSLIAVKARAPSAQP